MGQLDREKQIIGKGAKPRIIRRQHCLRCGTILALEITDKLGFISHSTYEWLKNGVWVKGRWFGNWTKCPKCGLEGNLPMDKPLSVEEIQAAESNLELHLLIQERIEEKRRKAHAQNQKAQADQGQKGN